MMLAKTASWTSVIILRVFVGRCGVKGRSLERNKLTTKREMEVERIRVVVKVLGLAKGCYREEVCTRDTNVSNRFAQFDRGRCREGFTERKLQKLENQCQQTTTKKEYWGKERMERRQVGRFRKSNISNRNGFMTHTFSKDDYKTVTES